MTELSEAQAEVRRSYRSASVGQLYSGVGDTGRRGGGPLRHRLVLPGVHGDPHYLPFVHLYGMRVFLPLGAGMWFVGLAIALWAREASVIGAWLTGLALIGVGIWAESRHRVEFAADG